MIGQTLAIEHPERVRSLVSIMSTTGSRRVGTPTLKAYRPAASPRPPHGRDAYIERIVKTFKVIGSPAYPMDEPRLREVAGRMYDRSHNPRGVLRQIHAISASGDRTAALRKLQPAGDRDPRHPRPAGPPQRRPRHRPGDPRRPPAHGRGHGPRPAPRPLADLRRRDRRHGLPGWLARRGEAARLIPGPAGMQPEVGMHPDAAERSRTSTEFPPHGPEPCASTSSATAAGPGNLPGWRPGPAAPRRRRPSARSR